MVVEPVGLGKVVDGELMNAFVQVVGKYNVLAAMCSRKVHSILRSEAPKDLETKV